MVYFISDLHFFHKNILLYEDRPFDTIESMNKTIMDNWNKTVNKSDKVFVLGDVALPLRKKVAINLIPRLHGNKVLIMGNHDKGHSIKWWIDVGFKEVSRYPILYAKYFLLSHEPLYMNKHMPYVNIHGHIHSRKLEGNKHFNVSVEHINYTPISFTEIQNRIKKEEF